MLNSTDHLFPSPCPAWKYFSFLLDTCPCRHVEFVICGLYMRASRESTIPFRDRRVACAKLAKWRTMSLANTRIHFRVQIYINLPMEMDLNLEIVQQFSRCCCRIQCACQKDYNRLCPSACSIQIVNFTADTITEAQGAPNKIQKIGNWK